MKYIDADKLIRLLSSERYVVYFNTEAVRVLKSLIEDDEQVKVSKIQEIADKYKEYPESYPTSVIISDFEDVLKIQPKK